MDCVLESYPPALYIEEALTKKRYNKDLNHTLFMRFRPELIVIDLDGTLIHSAPDIAYAANEMRKALGLSMFPSQDIEQWVGNGALMLVKRALTGELNPQYEPENLADGMTLFFDAYEANPFNKSKVYEGVEEGLTQLKEKGHLLACVTNKPKRFTTPIMAISGLQRFFEFVGSGDDFERLKPDPLPLLKTAERFNVAPAKGLMVGDSINDILAGSAAGFKTASVPYGYSGQYSIEELNADYKMNSILDLATLF